MEKDFLIALFGRLNEHKIDYCVLRNYETLPHSLNGSDIDIVFNRNHHLKALQLLDDIANRCGGKAIAKLYAPGVIDIAYCGNFNGKWWGVRFDTFNFIGTNGCDIFDDEYILRRCSLHNGVKVANDADSAILSYLKEIIGSGYDPKGYKERAVDCFRNNYIEYKEMFINHLGLTICDSLIFPILEDKVSNTVVLRQKLLISFKFRWLCKNHIKTLVLLYEKIQCYIKRFIKQYGFSVAVIGTDGSGKSTIIDSVTPILSQALHYKPTYEHMRPNLFPSIARLVGKPVKEGPTIDPHGSKPSGMFGSFLRLSYYWLDYVFGWWFKVYPAMVKRPTLFIFDRYFYDYIIDPRRGRINLPKWMIKLYGCFIPEPKLILCLGADPEIIHKRKPELPLEEVQRQVAELKKFCAKHKRAVWIDTGCEIEESVNQALEAITSQMAARYEKN